MRKNRLVAILIVSFLSLGLIMAKVSAQEIPPAWHLDGGVYNMMSSPYMPEDRDPQVSLVDNLGPYDETQWRFFRYDPELGRYAELKSPDWNPIKHDFNFGRGYWIISRNSTEIDIEGIPVGQNWLILEHEGDGWNQIGNIFDYDFPIVNLEVARISDPFNTVQLIDPVNNDLTYVTLQEFENGSYSYIDIPAPGKTTLEVGKGYWLRVREGVNEDVVLWFIVRGPSALSKEIYLSEVFLERVAQQENPPDPPPAVETSSSVSFSGGSGGGGCFIATTAYRDYDHPKVQLLREFRDRYLLRNSFGRVFVGMYYRYSPSLARFVANRQPIMSLVRFSLMPVIGISVMVSKINVYGFLIVVGFPLLGSFIFLRRRKGAWGRCKPEFSGKSREGERKR